MLPGRLEMLGLADSEYLGSARGADPADRRFLILESNRNGILNFLLGATPETVCFHPGYLLLSQLCNISY